MHEQGMHPTSLLSEIEARASVAAAQHAQYAAAVKEERAAEITLLERAVDLASPGLPAASSRIKQAEELYCPEVFEERYTPQWYDVRGVCLTPPSGPRKREIHKGKCVFEGVDVFLLDDGTLVDVRYEGDANHVLYGTTGWTSTMHKVTPAELAAAGWDLTAMIVALRDALVAETEGKKPVRTRDAIVRAKILRDLVSLLPKRGRPIGFRSGK